MQKPLFSKSLPIPKTSTYNARSEILRSVLLGIVSEKHEKLVCKAHRAACRLDMAHHYGNPRRTEQVEMSVNEIAKEAKVRARTIKYDLEYIKEFFDMTGWRLHIWKSGDRVAVVYADGQEGIEYQRSIYQFPSPWRLTIEAIHDQLELMIAQKEIMPSDSDMEHLIAGQFVATQIGSEQMKEFKKQRELDLQMRELTIGNEPIDEKIKRLNEQRIRINLEALANANPNLQPDCAEILYQTTFDLVLGLRRLGFDPPEPFMRMCRTKNLAEYDYENKTTIERLED